MRVYLFIEYYPNPYKPWIDTQIVEMLRAGHEVRIFAEGRYTSTIHDEVRAYDLLSKTSYYPATLKDLGAHGLAAVLALLRDPLANLPRVRTVAATANRPRSKLLAAARALLLPIDAPDVCYIHNLVEASRLTFLRELYPGARVCLYFHGGEVGGQPAVRGEAAVFESVDSVVTSTRFAARQAVERGCAPEKIAVIPLGFSLPAYAPSTGRTYREDGIVRFVSVGRMSPEKGFRYAVKAVRQLLDAGERRFEYRLIGTGIEYVGLQELARDLGLDGYVHFLGEKTRAEVAEELERCEVFVLPSVVLGAWAETQATVVQEALLMGCLTITTEAGGVPEANAEVMRRFSVPPADVEALADRMRAAIATEATEMARLARAGRAFAVQRYDIGPLMERILAHAAGRLPGDEPSRFLPPPTDRPGQGARQPM